MPGQANPRSTRRFAMRGLATSYMRRKLSAAAVLGRWEIVPRNCSPWGARYRGFPRWRVSCLCRLTSILKNRFWRGSGGRSNRHFGDETSAGWAEIASWHALQGALNGARFRPGSQAAVMLGSIRFRVAAVHPFIRSLKSTTFCGRRFARRLIARIQQTVVTLLLPVRSALRSPPARLAGGVPHPPPSRNNAGGDAL